MTVDQAKAIARRRWELTNADELNELDSVLAKEFVHHGPGYDFHGPAAYKEHLRVFFDGYPAAHLVIEETTGNESWVATVCTLTGRQEHPVPWSPDPSGVPMVNRLITIHAIADGKIVEEWIVQEWREQEKENV